MRLYQKILATGAIIASIGLTGCEEDKSKTLEGIVKSEFGTASMIVESNGALFGNESVKIGNLSYGLVLTNEQGEYTIKVNDDWTKPVIALAQAIEPGDKVKITYDRFGSTQIGEDGIGITHSNSVSIIEKAKK